MTNKQNTSWGLVVHSGGPSQPLASQRLFSSIACDQSCWYRYGLDTIKVKQLEENDLDDWIRLESADLFRLRAERYRREGKEAEVHYRRLTQRFVALSQSDFYEGCRHAATR